MLLHTVAAGIQMGNAAGAPISLSYQLQLMSVITFYPVFYLSAFINPPTM